MAKLTYGSIVLALLMVVCCAWFGKREKDYQREWAAIHGGELEVITSSGARVDILQPSMAIEVDYAKKWAEAIGQSLHYAAQTRRQAGILLIAGEGDAQFVDRLNSTIAYHSLPITVYTVDK